MVVATLAISLGAATTTPTTPTTSPPIRSHREAEKALFFEAFDRLENVAAAARELGFTAMTCYRWMVAACIDPNRLAHSRRIEFDQLRAGGVSRSNAARRVGVSIRTAIDWDHGVKRSNGRRIYPDGRVSGYNYDVPAFKKSRTLLAAIEQQLDPRYLPPPERGQIRDLTATDSSIRAIARMLHRSPSTASFSFTARLSSPTVSPARGPTIVPPSI